MIILLVYADSVIKDVVLQYALTSHSTQEYMIISVVEFIKLSFLYCNYSINGVIKSNIGRNQLSLFGYFVLNMISIRLFFKPKVEDFYIVLVHFVTCFGEMGNKSEWQVADFTFLVPINTAGYLWSVIIIQINTEWNLSRTCHCKNISEPHG